MNILNEELLSEFIRLENICNDIMGWEEDFQMLKRMRHLRNQLTHEVGMMNEPLCSQQELNWLSNFVERILQQTDPLAMLSKKEDEAQQQAQWMSQRREMEAKTRITGTLKPIQDNEDDSHKELSTGAFVSILICAVLVIAAMMYFFI